MNNQNRSQNSQVTTHCFLLSSRVTQHSAVSCSSTRRFQTGPSSADNFASFREQSFWKNRSCWNSKVHQCQLHESRGYLTPLSFHRIRGLVLMSTGGISEYIITSSDCCCCRWIFCKDDSNISAAVGPPPARAFFQPDSYWCSPYLATLVQQQCWVLSGTRVPVPSTTLHAVDNIVLNTQSNVMLPPSERVR